MIYKEISLRQEGSLPDAKLVLYIQEPSNELLIQERPLILLCPGGGYAYTSDREAEVEALQFLAMGYHAAVLRYSVTPATFPAPLLELAYSVKYIREHAAQWHVKEDKIVVQGSSAGGHLAACLGMFWTEEWLYKKVGAETAKEIQPNGMLLCYPVISAGEFAHDPSFEYLLGDNRELIEKLSLENQVSEHTPKTFVWHTYEDTVVPVENSLMLVSALRKHNISTEFHMYAKGRHGLALSNMLTAAPDGGGVQAECQTWITLAKAWLENL